MIHLYRLKNIQQSSTSSSNSTTSSSAKTITSRSSNPKQRQLRHKGRLIPDGGQWSDTALALDFVVSPAPFSATSILPLYASFLLPFLSSSACLRLIVFCRHIHPRQTPRVLSVTMLSILLSGPPTAIISTLPHNLFHPSIRATSTIFYPYTPTHPLPLYITPLYFYLSIYPYIFSHSLSIPYLSHSLSVTLYFSSTS